MRSSTASAKRAARPGVDEVRREPHPLSALFVPLEKLLVAGGDERLAIAPSDQLNSYGCRAFPRPEAYAFSSSTASTISETAYACAERARENVIARSIHVGIEQAFDDRLEAMRHELKTVLGIVDEGVEIVFSPSGTDAQLQALLAARAMFKGALTNIVVGPEQSGSGTVFTSSGRHFSNRTALNAQVIKGEPIAELSDGVETIYIGIMDDTGELLDTALLTQPSRMRFPELSDGVVASCCKPWTAPNWAGALRTRTA